MLFHLEETIYVTSGFVFILLNESSSDFLVNEWKNYFIRRMLEKK